MSDLVARLASLETGQVSDVLDEAGLPHHALSSTLIPLAPGRFAGRAACAEGAARSAGRNEMPALPGDALEAVTGEGTVLCIATGGFTGGAVLGGFVAYSLQRKGCVGVLTDGAIRDADEIRGYALPCVAGALTPINGSRRWRLTATDVPVTLPGQTGVPVRIAPGDYILGDADGVVVIPAADAQSIIEDAEELARIERAIGEALRAGGERAAVFKEHPRFAHIRPAAGAA